MSQTKTFLWVNAFPSLSGTCIASLLWSWLCVAAACIAGAQLGLLGDKYYLGLRCCLSRLPYCGYLWCSPSTRRSQSHSWLFALRFERKSYPLYCCTNVRWFFAAAVVYFMYYNLFVDYEQVNGIVRGSQEKPLYCGRLLFTQQPKSL